MRSVDTNATDNVQYALVEKFTLTNILDGQARPYFKVGATKIELNETSPGIETDEELTYGVGIEFDLLRNSDTNLNVFVSVGYSFTEPEFNVAVNNDSNLHFFNFAAGVGKRFELSNGHVLRPYFGAVYWHGKSETNVAGQTDSQTLDEIAPFVGINYQFKPGIAFGLETDFYDETWNLRSSISLQF